LKVPLGNAAQRFFAPECDLSFGNWLGAEVLNANDFARDTNRELLRTANVDGFSGKNMLRSENLNKERNN